MNVGDLIGAAPELVESLKGLGLGDLQINKLGSLAEGVFKKG